MKVRRTSMTENLKKANDMLKGNPELIRKFAEEMKESRIQDNLEATCAAVKNVLGIELSAVDVEDLKKDSREMKPEDLEKISGGGFLKNVGIFAVNRLVDVGNIICFFTCLGCTPLNHYDYD